MELLLVSRRRSTKRTVFEDTLKCVWNVEVSIKRNDYNLNETVFVQRYSTKRTIYIEDRINWKNGKLNLKWFTTIS